ncbi:MAG: hypothetical protein ACP5HG_16990 [Anaerolineae bacterium]
MDIPEFLYAVIGIAVVVLAVAAAWIELRAEEREQEPRHRRVLRQNPRYRDHVARRLRPASRSNAGPARSSARSRVERPHSRPSDDAAPPPAEEELGS